MVSVIGAGDCDANEEQFAEQLGTELAHHGIAVVTGGRGGVMEAVSRGAQKAGGLAIGILPGNGTDEGNTYLTVAIPTGMGELRNGLVVAAGEAVVAISGEYGTLSEIGLALKAGKTVIGWRTWNPVRIDGTQADIVTVTSVSEAINCVLAALAIDPVSP